MKEVSIIQPLVITDLICFGLSFDSFSGNLFGSVPSERREMSVHGDSKPGACVRCLEFIKALENLAVFFSKNFMFFS